MSAALQHLEQPPALSHGDPMVAIRLLRPANMPPVIDDCREPAPLQRKLPLEPFTAHHRARPRQHRAALAAIPKTPQNRARLCTAQALTEHLDADGLLTGDRDELAAAIGTARSTLDNHLAGLVADGLYAPLRAGCLGRFAVYAATIPAPLLPRARVLTKPRRAREMHATSYGPSRPRARRDACHLTAHQEELERERSEHLALDRTAADEPTTSVAAAPVELAAGEPAEHHDQHAPPRPAETGRRAERAAAGRDDSPRAERAPAGGRHPTQPPTDGHSPRHRAPTSPPAERSPARARADATGPKPTRPARTRRPRTTTPASPRHPEAAELLAHLPVLRSAPPHYRRPLLALLARALDDGYGPDAIARAVHDHVDPAAAATRHVPELRRALHRLRRDVERRLRCPECGQYRDELDPHPCPRCHHLEDAPQLVDESPDESLDPDELRRIYALHGATELLEQLDGVPA